MAAEPAPKMAAAPTAVRSADRTLEIRESPEFTGIAHRVRVALQVGHG